MAGSTSAITLSSAARSCAERRHQRKVFAADELKRGFNDMRRRGVAQGMVERLRRMKDRRVSGEAMLCDRAHWPALSE